MLSFGEVLDRFQGVKRRGDNQASARCPAHGDKRASLALSFDPGTGRILIHCHAGCDTRAVLDAAGLAWKDITTDWKDSPGKHAGPETEYPYRDEHGELLFQVVRSPDKKFFQKRPARPEDPADKVRKSSDGSRWIYKLGNTRRVPYRLPEVKAAIKAGRRVFIVEGEKDVESAVRLGLDATTNPGGAGPGKWSEECSLCLQGANAVIIPDNDSKEKGYPGQRHVADILRTLPGTASSVRILELPPERAGRTVKDLTDWINAGETRAKLEALADAAPAWEDWLAAWGERLETPPPAPAPRKKTAPKDSKRRGKADPAPQRSPEPEEAPNPEALRKQVEEAREAAGELFTAPDVLDRFYSAAVALGLEGEEDNCKVLILALTARVQARPINVYFLGGSSSGKTWIVERVLDLFPLEACHRFQGASPKAMLYTPKDFQHLVLFLNEVDAFATSRRKDGDNAGVALLRNLIEGNELHGETTITDASTGRFTTQEVRKPGPTGAILTGCHGIDNELMNRCLTLSPDETTAQTERVLLGIARAAEGRTPAKPDLAQLHALQRHLQGLAPLDVLIPFAERLILLGQNRPLRDRRDINQLFALIRAHALLHIGTRERDASGRIIATLEDYATVHGIAAAVFQGDSSGLTLKQREAVEVVHTLHKANRRGTVMEIGKALGLERSSVQGRLKIPAKLEFIRRTDAGKKGEAATWGPGEDLPTALSGLPTPEDVARSWTPEAPKPGTLPGTLKTESPCGVIPGGAALPGTPPGTPNIPDSKGFPGGVPVLPEGDGVEDEYVNMDAGMVPGEDSERPPSETPTQAPAPPAAPGPGGPETIHELCRALGHRWPDACDHFRQRWHTHRGNGAGTDEAARDQALGDLAQWAGAQGVLGVDAEALARGAKHWGDDLILWEPGQGPP